MIVVAYVRKNVKGSKKLDCYDKKGKHIIFAPLSSSWSNNDSIQLFRAELKLATTAFHDWIARLVLFPERSSEDERHHDPSKTGS